MSKTIANFGAGIGFDISAARRFGAQHRAHDLSA